MAWTNKPYCSVDDVKAASDTRSTAQDDLIASFIPQAQAAIDQYLGFSFQTDGTSLAPAERLYDGTGRDQLLLDRCLLITKVLTRSYSFATDTNGAITRSQNPDTDITGACMLGPVNLSPQFILQHLTSTFPIGKRNIVVQGMFGVAAIPADITRAAIRLTIHYMKQLDNSYQDQTGTAQYGQLVFRQQMPADVCDLLDRHRRRVFRGS